MRRMVIGAAALALLLAGASSAAAQYSNPTSSTTEAPTTTVAPPTTQAPPPSTGPAVASETVVDPGDTVTVATPPGTTDVFDFPSDVEVGMTRGIAGAQALILATVFSAPDGTVSVSVVIPEDTAPGIYYLYLSGVGDDGEERVLVVAITVRHPVRPAPPDTVPGPLSASGATGTATQPTAATWVAAPPAVAALQAANTYTEAQEAAAVDAVVDDDAVLLLKGSQLLLNGRSLPSPGSSGDDTRPLTAAAALALAGGGIVALRRRQPAMARRD